MWAAIAITYALSVFAVGLDRREGRPDAPFWQTAMLALFWPAALLWAIIVAVFYSLANRD